MNPAKKVLGEWSKEEGLIINPEYLTKRDFVPIGTGFELDKKSLDDGKIFASDWLTDEDVTNLKEMSENNISGKGIIAQIQDGEYHSINISYPNINLKTLKERLSESFKSTYHGIYMQKSHYDALIRSINIWKLYDETYFSVKRQMDELLYTIETLQLAMEYMTGERIDQED